MNIAAGRVRFTPGALDLLDDHYSTKSFFLKNTKIVFW